MGQDLGKESLYTPKVQETHPAFPPCLFHLALGPQRPEYACFWDVWCALHVHICALMPTVL